MRLISSSQLDQIVRDAEQEVRRQERAERWSRDSWLPSSDREWIESDPGAAIEAIREECRKEVARANVAMQETRDHIEREVEHRLSQRYERDAREVDAAYAKGYSDGFTAGQRSRIGGHR